MTSAFCGPPTALSIPQEITFLNFAAVQPAAPAPLVFLAGMRDEREVRVLVLPSEGFVLVVQGKPQARK